MKNKFKVILYKNKEYIVGITNKNEPFILDKDKLENLTESNYYLSNGYTTCRLESTTLLHHQILDYKFDGTLYVDHINRITTDNRVSNLRLISQSDQNKNQSKKTRNVILPEECNINVQDIPTFIWYIKANGKHGDRWAIEIKKKYFWKTTSTKKLSTKCKFELAKKHLRNLINNSPELLIGHCMNGELTNTGKILENEYIDILNLAGYHFDKNENLKIFLQQDITGLNPDEITYIENV
jgi:hypothetical protein